MEVAKDKWCVRAMVVNKLAEVTFLQTPEGRQRVSRAALGETSQQNKDNWE